MNANRNNKDCIFENPAELLLKLCIYTISLTLCSVSMYNYSQDEYLGIAYSILVLTMSPISDFTLNFFNNHTNKNWKNKSLFVLSVVIFLLSLVTIFACSQEDFRDSYLESVLRLCVGLSAVFPSAFFLEFISMVIRAENDDGKQTTPPQPTQQSRSRIEVPPDSVTNLYGINNTKKESRRS